MWQRTARWEHLLPRVGACGLFTAGCTRVPPPCSVLGRQPAPLGGGHPAHVHGAGGVHGATCMEQMCMEQEMRMEQMCAKQMCVEQVHMEQGTSTEQDTCTE